MVPILTGNIWPDRIPAYLAPQFEILGGGVYLLADWSNFLEGGLLACFGRA